MCAAWLRFEEEYGTLEDYDRAVLKVRFLITAFMIAGPTIKLLMYHSEIGSTCET